MGLLPLLRGARPRQSGRLGLDGVFAFSVAVVALLCGVVLVVESALLAVVLAALLLLLLVATAPVNLAVLAVPGVLAIQRIPGGGALSITEAVLLVAAVAGLPALSRLRSSPRLAGVMACFGIYVATMLVVLAASPSVRSALELVHRVVLVAGALVVGAWLAGQGRARLALGLLLHAAGVVAVFAVVDFVQRGFEPAYPLGLHKNYVGGLFVMLLLLLMLAPGVVGLAGPHRLALVLLMLAGAGACQSRGALAGGAVGLLAASLVLAGRRGALVDRRRVIGVVAIAVVLGGVAVQLLSSQLAETGSTDENNSVNARLPVERYAQQLWREEPVTGNGMRYFEDPVFQARSPLVQPPNNMVNEALAEGGVVQAAGLLAFLGAACVVVARARHPLALAGLALVLLRATHGMVDIYWTAGNTALPWLVVGMGVWLSDGTRQQRPQEPERIRASARASTSGHA